MNKQYPLGFTGVLKDNKSFFRIPVDTGNYMKLAGRKHPDRLADFCKRSSVNWMAAGSRLSKCSHNFFLLPASFSNMFFN